jgi:hypothetical protein
VKRIKPDWLAIGLTRSKNNFSMTERGYFLWVSNGWMFLNGQQQQTNVRFNVNDKITIRYDKAKGLLLFFKNGKSYEPRLVDL